MAEKKKRIWDNYQEIGEVLKSDSNKFVIAAAVRDGIRYINVREFYFRKRDGVWKPGKGGLAIPMAIPVKKGKEIIMPYTQFHGLLHKAAEIVKTLELYDEEHAIYTIKEDKKDGDSKPEDK